MAFNKKLPKILSPFHHQRNTRTHTQTLDKDQLAIPIKITTINVKNKLRKGGGVFLGIKERRQYSYLKTNLRNIQ